MLRYSSYHIVRNIIANLFHQNKLFEVFEKVYCSSIDDNNIQNHHADIITIIIIKTTVSFQTIKFIEKQYDQQQDGTANEEKKIIHELYVSTAIWYHKLESTQILVWNLGYSVWILKTIIPISLLTISSKNIF